MHPTLINLAGIPYIRSLFTFPFHSVHGRQWIYIGQSDAVAINPWRRFSTRDLCNSPLQHGTIVPWFNGICLASLLPISVPESKAKIDREKGENSWSKRLYCVLHSNRLLSLFLSNWIEFFFVWSTENSCHVAKHWLLVAFANMCSFRVPLFYRNCIFDSFAAHKRAHHTNKKKIVKTLHYV